MELKQIRQFLTLAQTLNFHRAAEILNIAQPPLSVSIAKLEAELGVRLFERHSRGVRLTAAGEAALPSARETLLRADEFREAVSEAAAGRSGRLQVGFVSSATYALIPKLVSAFRSRFPAVELRLEESNTVTILRRIEAGTLDAGLIRLPLLDPASQAITPLEIERLMLATPTDHPLGAREVVELSELRDETFIMYDRIAVPNLRALIMLACEAAGFQPRIGEETAQIHTMMALVESGMGVAFAPSGLRATRAGRARFVELRQENRPIELGLALAQPRSEDSRLARNFRDVALEVATAVP